MFTVKKKPLSPNAIWDAENNKLLCRFDRSGRLETEDALLAKKLEKLGHEVTGEADISPEEQASDAAPKEQEQAKAAQTGRKSRK